MRLKKYSLKQARLDLPKRYTNANKTVGGKCLVVAGSYGKWGAAILCAEAAARSGAGYTYIFDPKKNFPSFKNPDFLLSSNLKDFAAFHSIAIGPGFTNHSELKKIIFKLAKANFANVVLDAESINMLAKLKTIPPLPSTWIMTPHEGELSRLLKVSSDTIRADRKKYVQLAQKKMGCVILLKGHNTLIASAKSIFEIQSGNAALAKAGTGDVLTGMIAGFLSQKLDPICAACLASYGHGLIADLWIRSKKDVLSLLASDLIKNIPQTLHVIRK